MRYIPLLYSNGLSFQGGYYNCQNMQTFYFPVDSHTYSFTVTTIGYQAQTALYQANGMQRQRLKIYTLSSVGENC